MFLFRDQRAYRKVYYETEREFEAVVKAQLRHILPDCWIVDFRPIVLGAEGIRRQPDLAIIDSKYRFWVVVEVELSRHSLTHHVHPQLETLATGEYDESHAAAAVWSEPALNPLRMKTMVRYVPPSVAVVVNCRSVLGAGWDDLREELAVELTFLETYRADNNDSVFAVSGYLPQPHPKSLVSLKKDKIMNALVCRRPEQLPIGSAGALVTYIDEKPVRWKVATTADKAILIPQGGFTVRGDRNYELFRTQEGSLKLKEL